MTTRALDSFASQLEIIPLWLSIITPLRHVRLCFPWKRRSYRLKLICENKLVSEITFLLVVSRLFCNVNNNLRVNLGKLDEILRMENYWISDILSCMWYIQQTSRTVAAYRLHNSKLWKFDLPRYCTLSCSNLSKANFDHCI